MKINIITTKTTPNFHAGQKAPSDIIEILKKEYPVRTTFFDEVPTKNPILKVTKRLNYGYQFLKSRLKKEVVILQFPLPEISKILNSIFLFNMNFLDKSKTVILIHDVNGLRFQDKELYDIELSRLNKVKYVIVHNKKMQEKLVSDGLKSKPYTLELFDYLCDELKEDKTSKKHDKSIKVVYAGNLAKEKSPFIHELKDNEMKWHLSLYGVGIDKDLSSKITYHGKYPAAVLPAKLEGDVGLIWDGAKDTSDENYQMKNYTKYNNPHKLSCYMAAGLPVIVWEKSAISEFVKKNNLGYTIKTLEDINNLDFSNLEELKKNVKKIQSRVVAGEYTKKVFNKVLKDMGEI